MEGNIVILLLFLILFQFRGLIRGQYETLWSPVTVISLIYLYYVVWSYYTGGNEKFNLRDEDNTLFLLGSLVSYVCVLIGFAIPSRRDFKRWNSTFSNNNVYSSSILLFLIAFVGYSSFRGVHFTFVAEENIAELVHSSYEHYFIELLLLYVPALGLMIITVKGKKGSLPFLWFFIYYILVTFLFAGTRSRIVYITLASLSILYLFPNSRKPNYFWLIGLAIALFFLFSVMEYSRTYSNGIQMDVAMSYKPTDMPYGASENASVAWFSSAVMRKYSDTNSYIGFEPLSTALLMPIPRAVFPWKPSGQYLVDTQKIIIGDSSGGAAFMFFVEGFLAFRWLGIIIYGLFLGWLSRRFWDNYLRNPYSTGAILALALFNAACYGFVSRGYLASSLELFIYMVCLPFWLVRILGRHIKEFRP